MGIFIIAEIGINHNGDVDIARQLIEGAKDAGADAVKFQKRSIDLVYTKQALDQFRKSPWGDTNRAQKMGLEFGRSQYEEIDAYCKELEIEWFASAWDTKSQEFLQRFNCKFNKVASAMLSHENLIKLIAQEKKHTFISTGMHSLDEIKKVVDIFERNLCSFELMHTCSKYPMTNPEDANLNVINTLREKFHCNVGYSGHEVGLAISVGAAALSISSLERHITLDRSMYGSDQSASVEVKGFKQLVSYVRAVEKAMGSFEKRIIDGELEIREKLAPIENKSS